VVSFLEGVRNANKAINCFLLSAGGNILGAVASLPGGSPEFVDNTTKALRRLAGCDPEDDPVLPEPAFSGGQCSVRYLLNVSFTFGGGGVQTVNVVANGPVGGISVLGPPDGTQTVNIISRGATQGACSNSFPPIVASGPSAFTSGSAANLRNPTINTISRCDGQPDDCGSIPPVFPPATFIDVDVDVTYNIDEGPEVTVNIPFVYAPITTDIYGNFRIPFTFNFGGIEFSGSTQVAPEFNVTINPPPAPRGTDSPVTDLPGPDDEIPVTPSTFAERVVGVVVQSALVGEQQLTTIFTENIPQILAPRCGSVKFGYAIAGRSFWSPDIDIKDLNCFIPCPFSQGADTVAASPAPGVVLNYVPIFGAPIATVADLGSTPEP